MGEVPGQIVAVLTEMVGPSRHRTALAVQVALSMVAALMWQRGCLWRRRIAECSVLVAPLLCWFAPPSAPLRAAMAMVALLLVMRVADLRLDASNYRWRFRLLFVLADSDLRTHRPVKPHFDAEAWLRFVLGAAGAELALRLADAAVPLGAARLAATAAIAAGGGGTVEAVVGAVEGATVTAVDEGAIAAVSAALGSGAASPQWLHSLLWCVWCQLALLHCAGLLLVYSSVEGLTALARAIFAVFGRQAPRYHRDPILSVSLRDFWGARWNGVVHSWLARHVFARCVRRAGTGGAVTAAFAVSALLHFLIVAPAAGVFNGVLMAAFFLLQPLLLRWEKRLGVEAWSWPRARLWTLSVLWFTSPLFVFPALDAVVLRQ